jgi:methionyl-tRNA formyltransferase
MHPLVFFGTPEFAVPSLDALVTAGRRPDLVVSQPDRPSGRGHRTQPPAVVRRARELGLEVQQVEKVRDAEFLSRIEEMRPAIAVVAAFGQIFPEALLRAPLHGCVNVHASLLPRWRGAAPVQAAIVAGDPETGVCTMRMEKGLDTGPVYRCRSLEIGPEETAGELTARLAQLGAGLLLETLAGIESGALVPRPQSGEGATYAPRLTKQDGKIDWSRAAVDLARQVRGMTPAPGAFARLRDEAIRILAARAARSPSPDRAPGTISGVAEDALLVATGEGDLALLRVQRPGGRPQSGRELAAGARFVAGERFA